MKECRAHEMSVHPFLFEVRYWQEEAWNLHLNHFDQSVFLVEQHLYRLPLKTARRWRHL